MMNSKRAWLCAALIGASACMPAIATVYTIDTRETTANFDVRFLGLFPIQGKFLRTTGTLVYDRATRQGSIDVSIVTTTLVASTVRAQASARGAEFFDVEKFPSIEFKSSRFIFDESRLMFVEGNLTLVGVTQPVVLTVTDSHCDAADESEPARCRAAAELVVRRSSFGMKAWSHTVGEEVTIRINIRARQALERPLAPAVIGAESRAPVAGTHSPLQPAGERNSVR
jgi:polyisoprenoid-binding protein YceI